MLDQTHLHPSSTARPELGDEAGFAAARLWRAGEDEQRKRHAWAR